MHQDVYACEILKAIDNVSAEREWVGQQRLQINPFRIDPCACSGGQFGRLPYDALSMHRLTRFFNLLRRACDGQAHPGSWGFRDVARGHRGRRGGVEGRAGEPRGGGAAASDHTQGGATYLAGHNAGTLLFLLPLSLPPPFRYPG